MPITLEQIKQDITDGKSDHVYYSPSNLWWTHLVSDVEEATKLGRETAAKKHATIMGRTDIPQIERDEYDNLYKATNKTTIPLDPTGSPLLMSASTGWIKAAEEHPNHFGKHGLAAFIKAHHQNNEGRFSTQWAMYNEMIDDSK